WHGPPPLLDGEDTAAYDELLARISGAVNPGDIFEEKWVRDLLDLEGEGRRYRRLKASLLTGTGYKPVKGILERFLDEMERKDLATAWARHEKGAIREVNKLLASAGLTMDAVMARTLVNNINYIESIDRMIATAEARRNAIRREIERHRMSWR